MSSPSRYLDLLEKCLTGALTKDPPLDPWSGVVHDAEGRIVPFGEITTATFQISPGVFNSEKRRQGRDWPATALTMIGQERLRQLRLACETVVAEGVPGDVIETGVWRGGACMLMAAVLEQEHKARPYFMPPRRVFVADSFAGLPKPVHGADEGDNHFTFSAVLAVSEEQVRENFKTYDLLGPNVVFLKGWFADTLPTAPIEKLAVLRVDGDMYQSTMDVLTALYDKVSLGGFIIIDDYHVMESCKLATEVFRVQRNITEPIRQIDGCGIYWRKTNP